MREAVNTDRLFERASGRFEDRFDLVMVVPPFTLNMNRCSQPVRKSLKEILDQLRWQVADILTFKLALKDR